LFSLAATAALLVPLATARAQSLSYRSGQLSPSELARLRATIAADERYMRLPVANEAHHLAGQSVLGGVNRRLGSAESARERTLRLKLRSELANLFGEVRADRNRLLRVAGIPRGLAGDDYGDLYVDETTLGRLSKFYNDLGEGKIPVVRTKDYSPQELRGASVGIEDGISVQFVKINEIRLTDLSTGKWVDIWGDPHYGSERDRLYGNFTGPIQVLKFPGKRADMETIVIVKAAGGTEANAFGMPVEITLIGIREWVKLQRLDTENPIGQKGLGANLVYETQEVQEALRSAPRLKWTKVDESNGGLYEMRLVGSGVRPGMPTGSAAAVAVSEVKDTLKQYDGVLLSSAGNHDANLPLAAREFEARMIAAASLSTGAPNAEARGKAEMLAGKGIEYAKVEGRIVGKQQDLISKLETLIAREQVLADLLDDQGLSAGKQAKIQTELVEVRVDIEATKKAILAHRKAIEEAHRSPR
jgi:hypothetical protein